MKNQIQLFTPFEFYPSERRIFARREPLSPSQWAERHRHVPIGAHRGHWRNDISPHLVKIMDTYALPHVREITICKSPQTGGTEAMLCCLAYVMDYAPAEAMYIVPSEATASKISTDRIIPMIRQSPQLAQLISENPDDIAKSRIKLNNGAIIYMAWANSATALAAFPIKYIFFDETDKYPPYIGKETDPITLGEKRAITFRYTYKLFKVSTPTREDGPIWKAYQNADVQYLYHVKCPGCGKAHIMSIDNLRYPEDKTLQEIKNYQLATYQCPHCEADWNDITKHKAVRAGDWIRHKGKHIKYPRSVAFHLPAWISPDISLSEIAAAYLSARTERAKLIDFYNGYLAEPFIETIGGDVIQESVLYDRRYQYWPDNAKWRIPMKASILTAAVDVQTSPPRFEVEVVAWGEGYESWGIEYRVIPGDPAQPEIWRVLDEYLSRQWLHESGINMKISGAGIDTGGHYTREVYKYCKSRSRVFALKGSNIRGKPLITASSIRTNIKNKILLWLIGTETAKDILYDYMLREAPGAGYMHYHHGYDYSYFLHLTNEVGVTVYDKGGRPYRVWKKKSPSARTESLDIRVYNLAVLEIMNLNLTKLAKSMQKIIGQTADLLAAQLQPEDRQQPPTEPVTPEQITLTARPALKRRIISPGI